MDELHFQALQFDVDRRYSAKAFQESVVQSLKETIVLFDKLKLADRGNRQLLTTSLTRHHANVFHMKFDPSLSLCVLCIEKIREPGDGAIVIVLYQTNG